MRIRVKFLASKQRAFLLKVEKTSKLSTNELAKLGGVTPRSYRDWKRGKLNMPLDIAENFSKQYGVPFLERIELMTARWRSVKTEISRKGGLALFKKHGSPATPAGRKKGGTKALRILREKGIIPQFKVYKTPVGYSEEIAEFAGILLGDGGITLGQVFITLNAETDCDYVNYVVGLENKLFGEMPKLLKRNNSKAIAVYLNGIQLINYLKSIGLKPGNKVIQQVDVPNWIKKIKKYRTACLRGLMDTDGGVFLHKYKVNGKVYIYKKICFSNRSLPLLVFVSNTLKELGLSPKLITNVENKKVWLYNKQEVEQYLNLVGTHNSRLLKYQN